MDSRQPPNAYRTVLRGHHNEEPSQYTVAAICISHDSMGLVLASVALVAHGREGAFVFMRLLAAHRSSPLIVGHLWSGWLCSTSHLRTPTRVHPRGGILFPGIHHGAKSRTDLEGQNHRAKGQCSPMVPWCPYVEIVCWYKCLSLLSLLLVQLEVSKVPNRDILTHIFPDELHPESSPPVGLERVRCLHSFQSPLGVQSREAWWGIPSD